MIPPDSYVEPCMEDLERTTNPEDIEDGDIEDIEDDELEEESLEIRKPTPPKKRKVLTRSSGYWLDGGTSARALAISGLILVVGVIVVVLTTI
jgi:hypothetical protein